MSYCLNPTCPYPENLASTAERCQSCGSQLLLRLRYRVLKVLGQGDFKATYLAQDQALPGKPKCVIKQLRSLTNKPEVLHKIARKLFEREAKTLYKIGNHPQVPRLLDYFEYAEQLYLVQEYISGSTLEQEVRRGPLSEAEVKQFLSEILPIVQHIHERKVIHRNINPANLIRHKQDGKLVLIGFSAVKKQVDQTMTTSQSQQTALTTKAVGTVGFAPPEQIAMHPVYASDIYAVGMTCIYLLTGKSPKELEYNFSTGEILWERKVRVSDHFAKVLRKMLELPVGHRYQSANEVLRALEIEPYLDSLTKGMTAQAFGSSQQTVNWTEPDVESDGYFHTRSVAQVAAEIRARRANLANATSLKSGLTPHRVLTTKPSGATTLKTEGSTAQKLKVPRKLDSDTLLTAYVKGRRNFALHDLSQLDLERADLQSANFHCSKLDKTNLQGANLFNCVFNRASFNQANLRKANLSKACLSHADLEGADLRGADLSYADLNNANLLGANLCGANLIGAKLADEQLELTLMNWMTVRPNGKRGLL